MEKLLQGISSNTDNLEKMELRVLIFFLYFFGFFWGFFLVYST